MSEKKFRVGRTKKMRAMAPAQWDSLRGTSLAVSIRKWPITTVLTHGITQFLAGRADGVFRGISSGDPDFTAQRNYRLAGNH